MPDIEKSALLKKNDSAGHTYVVHPYTKAENVDYDNTNSGLASNNVKAAIDELSDRTPPAVSEAHKQLVTDGEGNAKWEDRLAYDTVWEVKYLTNKTLTFSAEGNLYGSTITETLDVSAGDTVIVTWDGVTYTCIVYDTLGSLMFGNITITGYPEGEDTGEPFLFAYGDGEGSNNWMVGTTDSSASHVVSVSRYGTVTKKIDAKYLDIPDGYAKPKDIILYENDALSCTSGSSAPYMSDNIDADFFLKEGKKYTVIFDGVTYSDLVCYNDMDSSGGYRTLGFSHDNPDSSEFPFAFYNYEDAYTVDKVFAVKESGTYSVTLIENSEGIMENDLLPTATLVLMCDQSFSNITYSNLTPNEAYELIMNKRLSNAVLCYFNSLNRMEQYYSVGMPEANRGSFGFTFLKLYDNNEYGPGYISFSGGFYVYGDVFNNTWGITSATVPDITMWANKKNYAKIRPWVSSGRYYIQTEYNGKLDTWKYLVQTKMPTAADVGKFIRVDSDLGWTADYATDMILKSSTADSTKLFKITVDDSGAISATEV